MSLDSCLSKIFHDISNSVSVLNFYVELLKGGDQVFSLQELDEISYNILVQLNVLKFAFQDDTSAKIEEYLVAYVAHKNKKLLIKQIDIKYMRFIANLLLSIINTFSKKGLIEVYATEDHFSVKLLGDLKKSLIEIVEGFNSVDSRVPGSLYMSNFLLKNNLVVIGNFITDTEFEIKLIKAL